MLFVCSGIRIFAVGVCLGGLVGSTEPDKCINGRTLLPRAVPCGHEGDVLRACFSSLAV